MLNNFIYSRTKLLFEEALNNNEVPEDAIGFIEDSKEIWNHGTYFDGSSMLTKITYSELKTLRDNGELLEGHLYRITDYVTTTVQSKTKSAGNVFDVIVLATSTSELSHNVRAIQHEGDTYFDGNDLGAWELWYDLDNDTEKYEWADATNGKGVIYRMIDEKRNDCPYDFKNILFYNTKFTTNTTSDRYYYTFSYVVSGKLYDGTVEKQVTTCYNNSMGVYDKNKKKSLNGNIFRNTEFRYNCHSNTFGYNCHSNTFGYNCHSNTFGDSCRDISFGNVCAYNTFDYACSFNSFGDYCGSNSFGHDCSYISFGDNCAGNTFGYTCQSKKFGNYCRHLHFNNIKTSTTLNDEYYDDGSGQLVPIKHPDLSTQPSILPYKFMGLYVYEQLIPVSAMRRYLDKFFIYKEDVGFICNNPIFLDCSFFGINGLNKWRVYPDDGSVTTMPGDVVIFEPVRDIISSSVNEKLINGLRYARIVYTSMPEEGSYGYNNY